MKSLVKAIAFDFDGVFVIDSDAVYKKEAWDIALAGIPKEMRDQLIAEGNVRYGNGKPGGRVEILRFALQESGLYTDVAAALAHAAQLFDEYVQAKIATEGVVPEALTMLEVLKNHGYALYLNSGTASAALKESASVLGIMPYIKEALGSTQEPRGGSKVDNLTYIALNESLTPSEVLMVGDSMIDVTAAKTFGCPFVGVHNHWNKWGNTEPFPVIGSVGQLAVYLEGERI